MKTWAAMYGLTWLVFLEIIVVLFPQFGYTVNIAIHASLGVAIPALAFLIYRGLRSTPCPERIKLISRTALTMAIVDGLLGLALLRWSPLSLGSSLTSVITFLHVGIALAVITQASSSATAFDMWEEKEFVTAGAPP